MEKKQLQFAIETKALNEGELEVIVNSGQPDRVNEILNIKGLDTSDYEKNPVVLWGHDYSQPPIGKAVKLWKDASGALKATIKFATEEYDFAKLVYKLFKGGYMSAVSIGFMPYEAQETKEGLLEYTKSQMLEFSAVVVPADPKALATQAKSLGVSEKTLDSFYKGELKVKKYKEETEEIEETVEPAVEEKSVEAVEKAGKVLSSKNRELIETCLSALQAVLDADTKPQPVEQETDNENKELNGMEHVIDIAKKSIEAVERKSQTSSEQDLAKARQGAVILDKAAEMLIKQLSDAMKKERK